MTRYPECPECGGDRFRRALAVRPRDEPADAPRTGAARPEWLEARARERIVRRRATTSPSRTTSACAWSRSQEGWTRIGRSLSADVRFDDPTVSRRHALVYRDADGARILDDRSLNGVFRTASASSWPSSTDGDEIAIGRFTLFFLHELDGSEEPAGTPVPTTALAT